MIHHVYRMMGAWYDETTWLELGGRVASASDDASTLEHRLALATGGQYACPPLHWAWTLDS